MRHGRDFCDIVFSKHDQVFEPANQTNKGLYGAKHAASLVTAHDKLLLKEAKEAHEKRNKKLEKAGKQKKPFLGIISADGFITENLEPIVVDLPSEKPPTRKVFTFKGIQSSCGVSWVKETDQIYNNRFPTAPLKSGLVSILIKTVHI